MGEWQYVHPEATDNLIVDPSWETTSTGHWTNTTGITGFDRVSDRAMFGAYSGHVSTTRTTQSQWIQTSTYIPITGGDPYTFSVYWQQNVGSTVSVRISSYVQTSSGGNINYNSLQTNNGPSTTWTRYVLTGTPATSAATMRIFFDFTNISCGTNFETWFDGAQLE